MDTTTFTVRPARPTDIPALVVLKWHLALSENAAHAVNASETDWQRDLFGPTPKFSAFVAEQEETVIGVVVVGERFYPGWTAPILHVHDLFVVPEHRRRGAGTALLVRIASEAISGGATFVELKARVENPARKLYRKAGFARVRDCAIYTLAGHGLSALAGKLSRAASDGSEPPRNDEISPPRRVFP
jgi:ribosomal protein S18 acetylase RimI-like enzyme